MALMPDWVKEMSQVMSENIVAQLNRLDAERFRDYRVTGHPKSATRGQFKTRHFR